MKVLLLRGNPRPNGYTQRLANLFLRGLREAGATVTDVDLCSQNILPCLGCFHCWVVAPGQCVHPDAMEGLLEQVLDADVLVCATPIYYFSMSSVMKMFFERTLSAGQTGHSSRRARGWSRNSIRYPERWRGKKIITLVTGALRDPEV